MAGQLVPRLAFGTFNWIFLIWSCVFGLVALIFLFYFNRLVALTLFGAIRTYTWLFYKIHVRCQAVQFSLLGGRVFLRGLEYRAENETIVIHQTYITWRYWYRRVAEIDVDSAPSKDSSSAGSSSSRKSAKEQEEDRNLDQESGPQARQSSAPCRISIHIRGIEWFVYNRSPAFDAVLASASRQEPKASHTRQQQSGDVNDVSNSRHSAGSAARPPYQSFVERPQTDIPFFLKLLPVHVECTKAAMLMGNRHTRSIMIAKVDRAIGKITAGACDVYDKYRQHFQFEMDRLLLRFCPNEDYAEPILNAGARANGVNAKTEVTNTHMHSKASHRRVRHRARHALAKLIPSFQRSVRSFDRRSGSVQHDSSATFFFDANDTGSPDWIGLTRYLDEEEEDKLEHDKWRRIEYAEEQVIAECPQVSMNFFWDVPGSVPFGLVHEMRGSKDCEVNGSKPPEWGLELRVNGGNVNYGPWADRQRLDLMLMFFPSAYTNAMPTVALQPGQTRMSTVFRISIVLDDRVTLRIRTRESSKDWKFKASSRKGMEGAKVEDRKNKARNKKKAQVTKEPNDRPAGWLDISFDANTAVAYDMDMIARSDGFGNQLRIDVISPIVATSVNSALFLRARSLTIGCDLSNPLLWNAARNWRFDIKSQDLDLFMLREHAFLIQDLVEDFTSGPGNEFYTFIPFHYALEMDLQEFKVFLNANDLNIIDRPSDPNDNNFLVLSSRKVVASVGIPADQFDPVKSSITFSGNLDNTVFTINTPAWNTYSTLLQNPDLGHFPTIVATGSYNYFSSTSSSLTDTLYMQIHGEQPQLRLYGFLLRFFMTFRENYFGEDVHFQTLDEYQGRLQRPGRKHAGDNDHKPTKQSNDLDVILSITTKQPCIMLPSRLYSATDCVKIDMEHGSADLRFTNYYMDLQTTLSPLSLSHSVGDLKGSTARDTTDIGVQTFVDGVSISGHRLFGLPPTEPTYVCNWDVDVGTITGEASVEYLGALVSGIRTLIYSLDDAENALPIQTASPLNDITFFRVTTKPVRLWLHVGQLAMLCEVESCRIEFNDWARHRFSERLHVVIPNLVLAAVDDQTANRCRARSADPRHSVTYGYLQTAVDIRMVSTKANFDETRQRQQDHIRLQDSRTTRTPWLLDDPSFGTFSQFQAQTARLQAPASPFPPMPEPIVGSGGESLSMEEERASLLSLASSIRDRHKAAYRSRQRFANGQQAAGSSDRTATATASGEIFSPGRATSSRTSTSSSHIQEQTGSRMITSMTFSSSYEQPYFPLLRVDPSDSDVPVVSLPDEDIELDTYADFSADGLPLEDDTIEHVTVMITLERGLRGMCTPPALKGVNSLLSSIQNRAPDALLDSLQLSSLGEVVAKKKQQHIPKINQLRLHLPGLAFRFRHHVPVQLQRDEKQQTYEIALSNLLAIARFGADRGEPFGKTPSSAHASLDKVELEARRTTFSDIDEARVLTSLTGLSSWLYEAESSTGELKFRTLEIASLNQKITHLAGLVNSAGSMADSLGQAFASTAAAQTARVQHLIYFLSSIGQHVDDPPILSSASFISRRWEEVVRTSDSWKMLMRLRWILQSMSGDISLRLAKDLRADLVETPANALARILESFEKWRSWDLENIRASTLMLDLYGNAMPPHRDLTRKRAKRLRFAFSSQIISLVIDPGRKKNKFLVEGLGAALQSDLVMSNTFLDKSVADHLVRRSTADISCEKCLLELKLELLKAAVDIFSHIKRIEATEPLQKAPSKLLEDSQPVEQQIHLVLGVKQTDVQIKTRHLKANLDANDFAASMAVKTMATEAVLATALLTARTCSTKVRHASRELIRILATNSNVYGNLDQRENSNLAINKWKIGAQCQKIEFDILESALGLTGIADQVVSHELIFIQSIVKGLEAANELERPRPPPGTSSKHVVQVTLHLQSYCITSVLLSSLRYRLEGRETRSSLLPDFSGESGHAFEFDVSEHAHSLYNDENGRIHEVCRLPLPKIHGRLAVKQADKLFIDVAVEIRKITLDASAVHGLFTTLSRTELTKFWKDLDRDLDVVKANYQTFITETNSVGSPRNGEDLQLSPSSSKELAYAASVSLVGVGVTAKSSSSLKSPAELVIESGPIHFGIRNNNAQTGVMLPFPELELDLDEISVFLENSEHGRKERCGSVTLSFLMRGTSELSDSAQVVRAYHVVVASLAIDFYTDTASMIIDILGYLQQRFMHFNLSEELHTLRARRRRRAKSSVRAGDLPNFPDGSQEDVHVSLFEAIFTFQMHRLQVIWHVGSSKLRSVTEIPENLVFSIQKIDLHTKKGNTARLEISSLQLQMVSASQPPTIRSKNSALLPEVVFKVAYMSRSQDRRIALQAVGKALDLRLTSQFIIPAANIQRSIAIATQDLRKVLSDWNETLIQGDSQQKSVFGEKKLASLAVDADFAGAIVHIEGKDISISERRLIGNRGVRTVREGKYGQFTQSNSRSTTTMRSPGLAFRVEYSDDPHSGRHLNGELKVAASNNELQPMFVPLVLEVLASVKDVVGDSPSKKPTVGLGDSNFLERIPYAEGTTDPTTILGDCKLNLGLRICEQSFSLTCKPIAQVTATARFKDIYITVSTVQPVAQERFFSVSSAISGFETTVQHVYSRESTGRFQVDKIHLSLMNSKHVSGMTGISSILNISPIKVFLNVKQLQDFLLFREIWYPVEIRPSPQAPSSRSQSPMKGGVQRYQQVTASNAFSWNAAINVAALELSLDLGQAVGRLSFSVDYLWITSRKDSEREQNLCLGFDSIGMESSGRMSGSVQLRNMRVRTNIVWPEDSQKAQTPLVQASLGFDDMRAKASFDYQTFAVADFQSLSFLLYNVIEPRRDRLVCTVNGDKIQAFCTANAAAQGVALYQAISRLIEEKQTAFEASLRDMEKFQKQKDAAGLGISSSQELTLPAVVEADAELAPLRLQVNVVVSLNALRAGVYPRSFRDAQIFKLEALDALARFSVNVQESDKVHTLLTVVLGQVRVALSTIERTSLRSRAIGDDLSIEDVVKDSGASRGGTILKVPRVVATMQTWQPQARKHVEYIFRSTFEGKVEVGWNYSRISFIRGMWDTHSKTLVQRLGKLPQSAVQITSSPRPDADKSSNSHEAQEKITAVVNVPTSKYTYEAKEPPVIQTPQLKDMGEATPPLEWIGLQRDRLPNLTHQVIIVPLLEFSKEVEDAYGKILGSS